MQNKIFNNQKAVNTLSTEPIGFVDLGEKFSVEVLNSFGREFTNIDDFNEFMNSPQKDKQNHRCTGPIEIKGLETSQSLAINICDIRIKKVYQCISYSTGFKKDDFDNRYPHIYTLENNKIKLNDETYISARPSIGYLATVNNTPMRGGRCSCYGGNLDIAQIHKGSTIYLPYKDSKALLGVGDVHFRQGGGEISGLALEADATVDLEVFACQEVKFPIIETQTQIVIIGTGDSIETAMQSACNNAFDFLNSQPYLKNIPEAQIYQLLGGCANLNCGNLFGKTPTFGVVIFKDVFCTKDNVELLELPKILNNSNNNYAEILMKSVQNYKKYKIYHDGDSRQLREIPNYPNLLIGRLNPKIYSFIDKKAVEAPQTNLIRAKLNQYLADYLSTKGLKTSTLATYQDYVLMTKEDAASQIEVVVKAAFIGSSKHTYQNLMVNNQEHKPYVRFDWRQKNPNEDVILPIGLAEKFIDVNQSSKTVLKAFNELKKLFNKNDLTIYDACFFLNRTGDVLCAEVSPDQMGTLSYIGNNLEYINIFKDKSKDNTLNKWNIMATLLGVN